MMIFPISRYENDTSVSPGKEIKDVRELYQETRDPISFNLSSKAAEEIGSAVFSQINRTLSRIQLCRKLQFDSFYFLFEFQNSKCSYSLFRSFM